MVDVVREATNNAPLIGASTAGEFTEEKVERGSVAVGLLSSDDIKIFTAILLIDGLSGVGEEATLLASYLFGEELKIVGGMAGDDFKMEKTFVFSDDKVCTIKR